MREQALKVREMEADLRAGAIAETLELFAQDPQFDGKILDGLWELSQDSSLSNLGARLEELRKLLNVEYERFQKFWDRFDKVADSDDLKVGQDDQEGADLEAIGDKYRQGLDQIYAINDLINAYKQILHLHEAADRIVAIANELSRQGHK